MLTIIRFQGPEPGFAEEAHAIVEWWAARPGCIRIDLVRNLDDQDLWAIVGLWDSVGAYRRSFQGNEAKMMLTPLLAAAVDEPSAYLPPDEMGPTLPRNL